MAALRPAVTARQAGLAVWKHYMKFTASMASAGIRAIASNLPRLIEASD